MTPDELNNALDAMQGAAGEDSLKPGLITVQTDDWISRLSALQSGRPQSIADGIRIRDIKVAVSSSDASKILTRAEAGDRGEPYRDLAAWPPNDQDRHLEG
ncbi:hypothetical protein [Brevundimonas sp. MEB006b]|uniref:hypothetical protein n=1 Tax=Brevundimonas sp. MEB006b TaxID=3040283 RepID=UPI002551643A|nr:hypothetical protein [Brevundimonas sp. MEB006b]